MKRLAVLLALLTAVLAACAAQHAFLGVVPDKAVDVDVPGFNGTGLLLRQVVSKGPADEAGLRGGDILTHFNGKLVEDGDDLSFFLRRAKPGEKVSLDWVRDKSRKTGSAKLGSRNAPELSGKGADLRKSVTNIAFLGIGSLAINQNLLDHFGVKEGHGILIDAVVPRSPAEKAGLRVGDILVDMDDHAVDSPGRLTRLMSEYRPGTKVRLKLVRNRQPLAVDVVFSSRESSRLEDPGLPAMPDLFRIPEIPDPGGSGHSPGRSALVPALDLLRRLVVRPILLLEN